MFKHRTDVAVLAGLAVAVALAVVLYFVAPEGVWQFVLLALVAASIVLQLIVFRRLERGRKTMERVLFQALDSFRQPYADVAPRFPFPSMRGPGHWTISPGTAQLLARLIHQHRPALIVELGSGVSSLVCGYCVERNGVGRVVSLDHEAEFAAKSRDAVAGHQLTQHVRVVDAPLVEHQIGGKRWSWYDTSVLDSHDVRNIDLLVVDGPPGALASQARYPALPMLWDRLSPAAIVLVDDGDRDDEQQIVRRWLVEYPQLRSEYVQTEKGAFVLRRIAPRSS